MKKANGENPSFNQILGVVKVVIYEVESINDVKEDGSTYKVTDCSLLDLREFLRTNEKNSQEALMIVNKQINNIREDNQITKKEKSYYLNRNIFPFIWFKDREFIFEW